MLGADESIFSEVSKDNQLLKRLALYLKILKQSDSNARIFVVIHTKKTQKEFSIDHDLFFIPIQSKLIQYYPFKTYKFLINNISKFNPELITCQNPFEIGLLGLMIKRKLHISLEIQIHLNLFSKYWLNEHRINNRLRYFMAKAVLYNANRIRVVSSGIKKNLEESLKIDSSKIFIAPVPVLIQDYCNESTLEILSPNNKEKTVLYVGRLIHSKNMPGLLRLCKKVLKIVNNVQFIIIGDGPQKEFVVDEARKIDPERIIILGSIPYSQLVNWYKRSDVFILPSLHEGFSRVLVESYLFKLPAVATKCGGPQDIIIDGRTGFLTNIEDIDLFSEKIIWLLEHPYDAKAMGLEGYEFVLNQFNPAMLAQKIVSEWVQLLNNYEPNHDIS